MKRKIFLFLAIVCVVGMVMMSGCNRPETYTVTFNSNGGTGTMAVQTFTEGEAQALTQNAFSYDGYTFTGWNTVQDGTCATYTDGQTITVTADMTLYAQWEIVPRWVDLGLPSGTLWATCNIGATTPEEYGDYFAWGETETKEIYDWSTYKYCNGSGFALTKYCCNDSYGNDGFVDSLCYLEYSDDVAKVNLGVGWRMPTAAEQFELEDNCRWTWTEQNGVAGYLATGPNGNNIFLPAAGGSCREAGVWCCYWSSKCFSFQSDIGIFLSLTEYDRTMEGSSRSIGLPVRPVVAQ